MGIATSFDAARMLEIENKTVVGGGVTGDSLILTTRDGTPINAGNVRGPVGPTGSAGPTGAQGPQGLKGDKGDTGNTGATGATGATGSQGPQGLRGFTGTGWHEAPTAPSGAIGQLGDFYINSTNDDWYEKTGASTWTLMGNLKGATGAQGPQGIQGPQGLTGTPGSKSYTQSAPAPNPATGIVGDYMLITDTGDYYEKTGASTWTLRGNLKGVKGDTGVMGPSGATGTTGATGPQGPQGIQGVPGPAGPIDKLILTEQATSPTTPAADTQILYVKSDGGLYFKNDSGLERGLLVPDAAQHTNPDFEAIGAAPGPSWSNYWGSAGTWSYDTTTAIQGTRSVKNVSLSTEGSPVRLHNADGLAAAGQMIPGSTFQVSIWAKHSIAGTNLAMELYTSPGTGSPEPFGGGNQVQGANRTLTTAWARYDVSFVIPPGHTKAQIFLSVPQGGTLWFDASGSKVTAQAPPGTLTGAELGALNRLTPKSSSTLSDYNNMVDSGFYVMDSTQLNRPWDVTSYLEVRAYSTTYIEQKARKVTDGMQATRLMVGGVWQAWIGDVTELALTGDSSWSHGSKLTRRGNSVTIYWNVSTAVAQGGGNATITIPTIHRKPSTTDGNLYFGVCDSASGNLIPAFLAQAGHTICHVFARAAGAGTLGTITYTSTGNG